MRLVSSIFQLVVLVAAFIASIRLLFEVASQTFALARRIFAIFNADDPEEAEA